MSQTVSLPLWLFLLILLFAAVTFASHFLLPSVRWFFRRRLERAVRRLNQRLTRPIQPFKLAARHDTIQRLIYDPQVSRAIVDHAAACRVPENVASQRARRYAREIVPAFSASVYFGFAIRAARLVSRALYDVRLDPPGGVLEGLDPEATVIFVMNHRSNMDYVLVTHLVAEQSALSYAVGEWARVWPLSRLIRAMGGYFIRRRSRGALYRRILARYVQMATAGGVTQGIYPEGGLSLDGRLQRPRLGLLSYIAEHDDPDARDVVFVPVGLNYDRVLEDSILTDAARLGRRRFRAPLGLVAWSTLGLIWGRMRGRFARHGAAAVRFGRPLSLRGFGGGPGVVAPEALADELMARIAAAVPVLPVPLLAWLVLAHGTVPRASLGAAAHDALLRMPEGVAAFGRQSPEVALGRAADRLLARELLREEGGILRPAPDCETLLTYYANSIAHHFAAPGEQAHDAATAAEISARAGS
ncbi:MAG: 1-acyl-sn-glycerol-3-phosphate acyltransferase [Paracoccaceae bacterium]